MRFIALFFIFLLQIAWAEEPWKIAIIGDTHDAPPRMEGSEGVAVNFIKTCFLPETVNQSALHQGIAVFRCSAALPYNCIVDRLSRLFVPDDRRLSLVCDADCRDILVGRARFLHCLHGYTEHRGPDFIGIVLHPARFRETLGKLLLRKAYDLSFLIKQNTAVARCAGIKCHDVFSHV